MATFYIPSDSGWQASGSFGDTWLRIRVDTTYNTSANTTTLKASLEIRPSTYGGRHYIWSSTGTGEQSYLTLPGGETYNISNGLMYVSRATTGAWNTLLDSNGDAYWTRTVEHDADGSCSVTLGFYGFVFSDSAAKTARFPAQSGTIDISQERVFRLTITQPTGATVTVKRGGTALSSGSAVYAGDVLTVTANAAEGYGAPSVSVSGATKGSGSSYTVTGNVTATATAGDVLSYKLTISQATGSTITVTRTSSPKKGAATGALSNNATIYYSDVLKVSFAASTGYDLKTHTVNGGNLNSGGSWTVTGAVTAATTTAKKTYVLSISQGAGSVITVTRNGTALSNNAVITHGDALKISFSASTGYDLSTHTVNGSTFTSGGTHTVSGKVAVVSTAAVKSFKLTISAGAGSRITVTRTSSPKKGAASGDLANNANVYYSDVLKISFAATEGYALSTHTVNSSTFTSGGAHTVSAPVSVAATASRVASTIDSCPGTVQTNQQLALTVNRASSSYRHKATLKYGSTTLYTSAAFADGLSFTVERSLFNSFPSAASFTATLSVQTYTDSACTTAVGSPATRSVTIKLDSDAVPVMASGCASAAPYNTGAVSGMSGYIAGYSRAEITLDSSKITAPCGATISQVTMVCGSTSVSEAPYRTGVLTGNSTITLTATDSRGRTSSYTLSVTVMSYAKPTLNTKASATYAKRCTDGKTPSDEGTYYLVKATLGTQYSLDGQNSYTIKAQIRASTDSSYGTARTLSSGVESDAFSENLNADKTYYVRVTVTDSLGNSAKKYLTLNGRKWAMKFRADGNGVGFGKAPEHGGALELPDGWAIYVGNRDMVDELDGKLDRADYVYAANETYAPSGYIITPGIWNSATQMLFEFAVDKSLTDVSSVTVTRMTGRIVGPSGPIDGKTSVNSAILADSNYSIAAAISANHRVRVTLTRSSAISGFSASLPLTVIGYVTLKFA